MCVCVSVSVCVCVSVSECVCVCLCICVCECMYVSVCVCFTEKMSPVYICQNDKPMTCLALSTAHQVKTNLCQLHSLKGCHIFVINLSKTSHPQFLFYAVDDSGVPI